MKLNKSGHKKGIEFAEKTVICPYCGRKSTYGIIQTRPRCFTLVGQKCFKGERNRFWKCGNCGKIFYTIPGGILLRFILMAKEMIPGLRNSLDYAIGELLEWNPTSEAAKELRDILLSNFIPAKMDEIQ